MKSYIIFNDGGKILRCGICAGDDFKKQAKDSEFVMEGRANDTTQKIVGGKIVNKTPAEIAVDNPLPVSFENRIANITNEQYQKLLERISALEKLEAKQ